MTGYDPYDAEPWRRRCEQLEFECRKIREAVRRAGFGICQTSGDWSIHDVSEHGKEEERKTIQVINENIELKMKLRDADIMAAAIDDQIHRHLLGSRTMIADKRLNYGEPFTPEKIAQLLGRQE